MRTLVSCLLLAACTHPPSTKLPTRATPKGPLALTYLGVAGWQLDSAGTTILVDPYFSRPNLDGPVVPDAQAISRYAPERASLIVIGHSHVDHLLDAPAIALASGAEILGSESTARVAVASGVPADHVITVKGGEDLAFEGYSVRVIPSLHSALDHKHVFGRALATTPTLPMKFADYEEGGTFIYLVRIAGHQVLVTSTANFIERELEGLRPDIAIIAPGLRQEIHDYTCRLLRVLGQPPVVYATHFDDWRSPPPATPAPSQDTRAFVEEVRACSPKTRVIVPRHFERMPQ
jgi:L-ascorbate metabolism protein UlaG (beta-lactamase superfamily)